MSLNDQIARVDRRGLQKNKLQKWILDQDYHRTKGYYNDSITIYAARLAAYRYTGNFSDLATRPIGQESTRYITQAFTDRCKEEERKLFDDLTKFNADSHRVIDFKMQRRVATRVLVASNNKYGRHDDLSLDIYAYVNNKRFYTFMYIPMHVVVNKSRYPYYVDPAQYNSPYFDLISIEDECRKYRKVINAEPKENQKEEVQI